MALCINPVNHSFNKSSTGVRFLLSKETKKVRSIEYVNDRIAQIILRVGGRRTLSLTQVYAPHAGYEDTKYDESFQALAIALYRRKYTHGIATGDFNAIIGEGSSTTSSAAPMI